MHSRFGLTLMVNHACNLRCTYCYTGDKLLRPMRREIGEAAINRALNSLLWGGTLELGFFGGEPLVEPELIQGFIGFATRKAHEREVELDLSMTTNGTIDTPAAWAVMLLPELRVAISHDGRPEVHDRHRLTIEGHATSARVAATIERLLEAGKPFRVVMVVRPDTVELLASGMEYLYELGVRQFDPSLDLWTTWTRADGEKLKRSIHACANFWADRLPDCSVSWFDEKAAKLTSIPTTHSARCGFGYSEIAIAPSGNLYPCERLIGADEPGNAMRLPGDAADGADFLALTRTPGKSSLECAQCTLNSICSTTCRCSNYVRTGDTGRPDALLCLWDQACVFETSRALKTRMISHGGGVS